MKFKKLDERATLPTRGTPGAAGLDIYAIEDAVINGNTTRLLPTGLAMELPEGHVGLIWDRSSLAFKHDIVTVAGCIDADYRGPLGVVLHNLGKFPLEVKAGERIAQFIVLPVAMVTPEWADNLDDTERGAGGYGSTGR